MNPEEIKEDWNSRGYSFGIFKDPPGQVCVKIFIQNRSQLFS